MRISKTSHTILHLCRRCLFRSVNLGGTSISNTFMDLVQYNPTVGQYVRELALHVNALDRQTDPSYWRPGDASNIPLLTQTPFVEKLSIHGCIPPPTSSWNFLCPTFQQPILNRIHSASLCNPDRLTPVWTLCSCLGLLLDLHISYIRASRAWTSTTTFSYVYCFSVPISPLRPPELYTRLISVGLSCKQCNLSYWIDLQLFGQKTRKI